MPYPFFGIPHKTDKQNHPGSTYRRQQYRDSNHHGRKKNPGSWPDTDFV